MSILTEQSKLEALADRVNEHRIGHCRLLTLHTPVRSVVTWRGSFMAFPDFARDEDLVQNLTVSLLDKGTKQLDRFAIAELLENRGAQVEFSSDGLYVDVSGRALSEDVPDVMALVAEQLREPLFDSEEFDKAKARIAASIRRSLENTGAQATGALTRSIYPKAHPNYTPAPEDRLQRLMDIGSEDVSKYHDRHFGANAFTLVVVGDIDEDAVIESVRSHFGDWQPHDASTEFRPEAHVGAPRQCIIPIPEKQNVDVRLGHALPFRRNDDDYIPAYLTTYILGGNFSARLMQTVRDEMGLTYGIRAGLYGISTEHAGHWHISVTLSQENVERGVEATRDEVRRFVEHGVTEAELLDKKTTIVGSFKVGLATTAGLASSLLKNAERGFEVAYLDRFPEEVESVTLKRANAVIQAHFHPDRLHTAMAGSIQEAHALSD